MNIRWSILRLLAPIPLLLMATACGQETPPDPARPEAYAVQLPLEPASGSGAALQAFTLPPVALAAIRRADLGDIRVFDARGRSLSLAVANSTAHAIQHRIAVRIFPVVGGAVGSIDEPAGSGVKVRIEGDHAARVVTVDAGAQAGVGAAPSIDLVLDTPGLREPAIAIALDADIPAGEPVTLTLSSSADLQIWEPLAQKVLFRPAAGLPLLGGGTVALTGVDLHNRYVGIGWAKGARLAVTRAEIITSASIPPARVEVATGAIPFTDAHELRFDLPAIARLRAFTLTATAGDGVLPVKLYSRDQTEDPWALVAAATLREGRNVLEIAGSPSTSYRLVADSRTAGFVAAPKLALLLDPVELLVAPVGTPPYRLAIGQSAAPATYLTLDEIAPQGNPPTAERLPQARVIAPTGSPAIELVPVAAAGAFDRRKAMLWSALLLGALVLGFVAIRLLRETARGAADERT